MTHVVFELRTGGMELGVVKLVNGLDAQRIVSSVCSTRAAGELRERLSPSVRLHELARRDGNDPAVVYALYRLFRRERPHIVHTHAWGTLIEGLVAARLARVPVVVHGEHGTLQLRPYQRWLQRRAWARTNRVLSVSGRLAERMARDVGFPLEGIHTIRNGVDLSRFGHGSRVAARRDLDLPADTPIVGTVGRLVPVKDHLGLIEALAELHAEGSQAMVVIAGEGPARPAILGRAAALGVEAHVRLLGHRGDVERVLPAFDVFALPSLSEGLSNTILEAMACRLPVIATRVGGADELVVDGLTGILVPARSPRLLATAVRQLLGDRVRREALGDAGRRRAESEFSLPAMIARYEALYFSLAGRADAAGARVGHALAGEEVA